MDKKILIIDDDPQLREMYQSALEAEGFEVYVKADGEKALDFIAEEKTKPDLIILDIMIPKIHGLNVLDMVKNDPDMRDTKIIMLSALSDEATKKKAAEYGADKYLVKSEALMSDVVETVKKIIKN